MATKIETRVPAGEQWVKLVTAVKPTAKTGHDWTGDWLRSEKLIDLPVGTVVVAANNAGSRNKPRPGVRLCVLKDDGAWLETEELDSTQWAFALRETARRLLAASDAIEQRRIILEARIATETATIQKYTDKPSFSVSLERAVERREALQKELAELAAAPAPLGRTVSPRVTAAVAELTAALEAEKSRWVGASETDQSSREAISDALSYLGSVSRCIADINDSPVTTSEEQFAWEIGAIDESTDQ